MERTQVKITDNSGEEYPNLRGVFRRAFPIPMSRAERGESPIGLVTYCGKDFRISVAPK